MINIMLVVFGGLALYLYFLESDDKNANTTNRSGKTSALTTDQQSAQLRSSASKLRAQIKEIDTKIQGLKKEHTEAVKAKSKKGNVALGTLSSDPIFFENAIRREETRKAELQAQLSRVESQLNALTAPK